MPPGFGDPGGPAVRARRIRRARRTGAAAADRADAAGRADPAVPAAAAGRAAAATSRSADAADGRTPTTPPPTTPSAARPLDAAPYQLRAGLARRTRALHPPELRRHVRRPAQDSRHLRRHAQDQLHGHLQRQPRRRAVRSVRDGPDRGDARRQLLRRVRRSSSIRAPACRSPATRFRRRSMSPAALALLRYIPSPNLPGTTRNFHYTTTTDSVGDNISGRITHNFTPRPAGGRGGGGRGGGSAAAAAPGGRGGGRGQQGTTVLLNAQVQYRRSDNERVNVFPTLGGHNESSSLAVPDLAEHRAPPHDAQHHRSTSRGPRRSTDQPLRERRGRRRRRRHHRRRHRSVRLGRARPVVQQPVERARSRSVATRPIGASPRPTPGRGRSASTRCGSAATTAGTPRATGPIRTRAARSSSPGCTRRAARPTARGDGLDFADFLLGLPQQASLQYGPGNVELRGRSMSLFVQDDWRKSATLTFNLGLRYELLWPFTEAQRPDGQSRRGAGLHRRRRRCVSGGTGPFTGAFPSALIARRHQQHRAARRRRLAHQAGHDPARRLRPQLQRRRRTRTIARQLVGQPPFAVTNTAIGTSARGAQPDRSARDRVAGRDDQQLRRAARLRARDACRPGTPTCRATSRQVWNVGAGYTHTRGSSLDILRAPNRGPDGLRIEGVQPFLWQSSEGSSVLHAGDVPRCGAGRSKASAAASTYTLARSRDNASSIGGGGVGGRPGRSQPRRRVGALELRSAPPADRRRSASSCRSGRTGRG